MTSTSTQLTVVVHLTVAAERAYTVSAQLAEALRSAAGLPGVRMTVDGAGVAPETIPRPRQPLELRAEPDLRILVRQRRVLLRGAPVELTRLEFDLLLHLCSNPDRVHRRSTLMTTVWQLREPYRTRTIDVHIRRLRRKLGDLPLICTVRGVGYRVDASSRFAVDDTDDVPAALPA